MKRNIFTLIPFILIILIIQSCNSDDDNNMKLPQQSPIDINTYHSEGISKLQPEYTITDIEVEKHGDNYTYVPKEKNYLTIGDAKYELLQFHFHHPSEHKLKGKYYDSELHLVHATPAGELFIVGVFLDAATTHEMITDGLTFEKYNADKVELKSIDINSLVPKDLTHYNYMGSLTTPPFTEGAHWMVMKYPVGIGKDQLNALKSQIPTNSREPQDLNGREIKLMND